VNEQNKVKKVEGIAWEPMRIAVRGHLVPLASEVKKRRQTRGKRRIRARQRREQQEHQSQADMEEGQHRDALEAEQQASWHLLSDEEEQEAVRIIGPRPWYTIVYDTETVVMDVESAPDAPDVLRFGQLLRVGYYELRGVSEWEVARRLRRGALVADDRHRLREAGFILPEPHERIMVDGRLIPAYAGYEAVMVADRETVEEWVDLHGHRGEYKQLHIRTKQEFIKEVFYRYAYGYRHIIGARVVGHQLFYDLSRMATDTRDAHGTLIRGVRRGGGWARRGFSLKLCDCPFEDCGYHPRMRIVKLGRFKHRYAFERTTTPTMDAKRRHKRDYLGRFLDTIPFGLALRKCRSADLRTMGDVFNARVHKRDLPDFSGPPNEQSLDYLVGDVQATYWLAVAELDDYAQHRLGRKPESIYSSASLAKAYLHEFAFPRASQRDWHLSINDYSAHDIGGFAATTYFGGRAEVHHRAEAVEIMHLDFKSEYVAVNDAMGLQDFWLARDVTVQDATTQIRARFASRTPTELLAELQRPQTWRTLRILVKLRLDGSILLPIRADYRQNEHRGPSGIHNIGQQYARRNTPLWFILADVVAGIIREGVVPDIDQALAFLPGVEQVETRLLDLFGDPAYHVDPKRDTVWTKFIDVRRAVKKAAAEARARGDIGEADRLDGQQNALKEIALAGSYGILEELNEHIYTGKAIAIDVYALARTRRYGNVIEEPGPYFAGAIGTLIPAGGRLLLAMAEQLFKERGISFCFMDTDSITPIRPPDMDRDEFRRRVQEVVDWFIPLNPYAEGGSLLSYEDQNYAIDPDNTNSVDSTTLEPLYCVATSAKRYAEFNQWHDGQGRLHIRLRKFTSHGLGQWGRRDQEQYELADYVPPPHTFRVVKDETGHERRIPDSRPLGGPPWVYKLQYDFVRTVITGYYPNGEPLYRDQDGVPWYFPRYDAWLDVPAFYQFAVETCADYERVKHWPGMRPGNFVTVYPSAKGPLDDLTHVVIGRTQITLQTAQEEQEAREDDDPVAAEERLDQAIHETLLSRESEALISPFATSSADVAQMKAAGWIRRVKDMSTFPPDGDLKTMYEVVRYYFAHREEKAANPLGKGTLRRRHIEVIGVDVIGVESNKLAQAGAEDTAEVLGAREQLGSRRYGSTGHAGTSGSGRTGRSRLASLFGETMPDLLAASCLSRKTLERMTHTAYQPSPETLAAIEQAMQLLDHDHPQSIAGWRDILTPEALAAVLDPWSEDAQDEGLVAATARSQERERELVAEHRALLEERERSSMDREAARLARDERAEVARILRRAGGIRVSTDPATGRPINHGEWELLPASVRRREGRLTMDQAVADVLAELPALGWETADDLVKYFERSRSRELQRQQRRPANAKDALEEACDRLRGRTTWTEAERSRLVRFMQERRARLSPSLNRASGGPSVGRVVGSR
jgi:hypothetical protein